MRTRPTTNYYSQTETQLQPQTQRKFTDIKNPTALINFLWKYLEQDKENIDPNRGTTILTFTTQEEFITFLNCAPALSENYHLKNQQDQPPQIICDKSIIQEIYDQLNKTYLISKSNSPSLSR